ncbi:hypothetical protein BKA57DRAFT_461988 [Linnemannia elongata]|nr:hypothetical protein BKA57DRAFT_461988 [Linnemannia elongata]
MPNNNKAKKRRKNTRIHLYPILVLTHAIIQSHSRTFTVTNTYPHPPTFPALVIFVLELIWWWLLHRIFL